MSDLYNDWLITPELLAAETRIRWFRHYGPYLYVREGLLMGDVWNAVDPLRTFGNCEILGVAEYRGGYKTALPKPMRRCWFLYHAPGDYLDGIAQPAAPDDKYGGVIVQVHPKETRITFGKCSPLGYTEREVTSQNVAEATKYRDAARAFWAADAIENERRKEARRVWVKRKEAEARAAHAQYKARIADVE